MRIKLLLKKHFDSNYIFQSFKFQYKIYSFHKYPVSALENCVFIIISDTKQQKALTAQSGVKVRLMRNPCRNSRCRGSFSRKRGVAAGGRGESVGAAYLTLAVVSPDLSVKRRHSLSRSLLLWPLSATWWCFLAPMAKLLLRSLLCEDKFLRRTRLSAWHRRGSGKLGDTDNRASPKGHKK